MKKSIFCFVFVLISIASIFGQIDFGIKAGLHSIELGENPTSIFQDPDNTGQVSLLESNYGVHVGLFTSIKFLGLFVEPSFLFNSTSVNYRFSATNESGDFKDLYKESFKNIDVPFMVGMKFLIFDVFAGPVAHIKIEKASDLIDFESYGERVDGATYGFQTGIGLSLGKVKAQISYEGNLSKFGEVIKVGNSRFMIDENASRLLLTMGYKF